MTKPILSTLAVLCVVLAGCAKGNDKVEGVLTPATASIAASSGVSGKLTTLSKGYPFGANRFSVDLGGQICVEKNSGNCQPLSTEQMKEAHLTMSEYCLDLVKADGFNLSVDPVAISKLEQDIHCAAIISYRGKVGEALLWLTSRNWN